MSATNFNTKNDTFRKLMGNGLTYRIPRFQRDYSWADDEWEDLWLDLVGTIKPGGEPAHYMGYLVLQSDNDKAFDVIDGQQRLTTLSILILAALKNFERLVNEGKDPERNKQRMDDYRRSYIGFLDPVTFVPRSKLTLNRNNDHYFQTYLVPLGHLPVRGFRASEHSLRKAFEWFEKRIREYLGKSSSDQGTELAQFIESLSDKLFFTVITVTDELNAYKVFETLNARGVRLSATDLLKNYLFSVLHRESEHEHEMKTLEDRWESIVGRLGNDSFPDFLRMHWNSRHDSVRQTELFKVIRSKVTTREHAFNLLREMEEDMDHYLSLTQPETSHWIPALKTYALELRMFNVRQPLPLLLAARRKLADSDMETLMRACVVISFRFNVIAGLQASGQESTYGSVAQKISNGSLADLTAILSALKPVYIGDQQFKAAFGEKTIRTTNTRNKRVVRYLLCALEKQASGYDHDADSDSFNIEHILPQNLGEGWSTFRDEDVEDMVYRLGNMTLMQSAANRDAGNAVFADKKLAYAASHFEITKKVATDNADWTPERLRARQNWMANQASAIWRIAQLS
ncbi:MAG: DUF262 domain-containing protein [Akkermansiaceae bacterium]|nr:DUF262 domain-containing protein [Akkermansiaceae bacterium]